MLSKIFKNKDYKNLNLLIIINMKIFIIINIYILNVFRLDQGSDS